MNNGWAALIVNVPDLHIALHCGHWIANVPLNFLPYSTLRFVSIIFGYENRFRALSTGSTYSVKIYFMFLRNILSLIFFSAFSYHYAHVGDRGSLGVYPYTTALSHSSLLIPPHPPTRLLLYHHTLYSLTPTLLCTTFFHLPHIPTPPFSFTYTTHLRSHPPLLMIDHSHLPAFLQLVAWSVLHDV